MSAEPDCTTNADADARRLALEAIATLVHVKKTAADHPFAEPAFPRI